MLIYDVNIFLFRHFGHAVVLKTEICVTLVLLANFNELYPDKTTTERHMRTNAPLSWWPGKGNDFLCPSKQHPHDWSVLGAEPCCGLTWSQDGRFYNRHCPLRFCLHGWPLLLNHKHLLTLSDDLMFALLSAEVLLVNLIQRVRSGAGTRNVVKITAVARKTRQSRRWWQQARHKSCQLLGKVSPLHARGEETWGQWTVIN